MRAKLVRESLCINDYYENILVESILNENFDLENIKQTISKIVDKKTAVIRFIKKFNDTNNLSTKKYIGTLIVFMFLSSFVKQNNKWSNKSSVITKDAVEILVNQDSIDLSDIKKAIEVQIDSVDNLFDATTLNISKDGINLIKHHEKLRLKAYDINDGKVTIGYGHTTGNYKIGDDITEVKAIELLRNDLQTAESGVKRIFKQWKEKGIDRKISQSMYDSMVSMAFNIGVSGLRSSDFIKDIKTGDYSKAAGKILTLKINDKFPGLKIRRAEEYKLFNKDIT